MTFDDILAQVVTLLQRQGRVSYRALKVRFDLDDEYLDILREELLYVYPVLDDQGKGLVWTGASRGPAHQRLSLPSRCKRPVYRTSSQRRSHPCQRSLRPLTRNGASSPCCSAPGRLDRARPPTSTGRAARGGTGLSRHVCEVIARFEGHIAQYLAMACWSISATRWRTKMTPSGPCGWAGHDRGRGPAQYPPGAGRGCSSPCAWGSTPGWWWWGDRRRYAAGTVGAGRDAQPGSPPAGSPPQYAGDQCRDLAAPAGLLCLPATRQPTPQGFAQPLEVYQVLAESGAQSPGRRGQHRPDPAGGPRAGSGAAAERWAQVKDGLGQVVLLSGEAGIGKSRLVQVLQAHVASEPQAWLTPCQCSPITRTRRCIR